VLLDYYTEIYGGEVFEKYGLESYYTEIHGEGTEIHRGEVVDCDMAIIL